MDDDGKINGKFVWNKVNVSPRDTLLNLVKLFYKQEEVFEARDVLPWPKKKFRNEFSIFS